MSKNNIDKLKWTFLTNHAHVLLCLTGNNAMLMKDIAKEVGITERAVQRIIADLVEDEYIKIEREGRSNTYKIHKEKYLKHPIESHRQIKELLTLIE
jgi:predicted transcriptional regulator